jgi:hypothetical protein
LDGEKGVVREKVLRPEQAPCCKTLAEDENVNLFNISTSILGYTLTGDLPGTNTFSQSGNN